MYIRLYNLIKPLNLIFISPCSYPYTPSFLLLIHKYIYIKIIHFLLYIQDENSLFLNIFSYILFTACNKKNEENCRTVTENVL